MHRGVLGDFLGVGGRYVRALELRILIAQGSYTHNSTTLHPKTLDRP